MHKVTLQNLHDICGVLQTFNGIQRAICAAKKYCEVPGSECYTLLKCKYSVR